MRPLKKPSNNNRRQKTCHPDEKASPHLPGEIFQLIFAYLPFSDLMQCRKVSRVWYVYCPSQYSILKEALFLASRGEVREDTPIVTITFHVKRLEEEDVALRVLGSKYGLGVVSCILCPGEGREDDE